MFTESIANLWKSKKLKMIVNANFEKAVLSWCKECPEELEGIAKNELDAKGLTLSSINVTQSNKQGFIYTVEAEYSKTFLNGKKVIYILKFYDDFIVFDDVLYTASEGE